MNCEFCQSPVHIWFQCPKKPDGWKPARLAKRAATPEVTPDQISLVDRGQGPYESTAARKAVPEGSDARKRVRRTNGGKDLPDPSAGTRALPVDTNGSEAQKVERRSPKPEDVGSIPTTSAKFDKKAWMREYMREHRKGLRRRGTGN